MGPLDSERVVGQLRELYRRYGYIQYKMSKFEPYDLYVQNKSFLVSEDILTFTDADGRLMALKTSRGQYRMAKSAAVACSGFLSLFLPMAGWLLFCKFILGSGSVEISVRFMPEFAEKFPFLYGMMYAVNAGVLGAVFAVMGAGFKRGGAQPLPGAADTCLLLRVHRGCRVWALAGV